MIKTKIGTALLEENNLLKRQKFELETKLTFAEEKAEGLEREKEVCALKIEELLYQLQEIHNNSEKENQIRTEMQQIFNENDRNQNQIINEYIHEIDTLEKSINVLQRNLKEHITTDNKSTSYTKSGTVTDQNMSTPTPTHENTTVFIELAEVKSKQHLLEEDIKS
ncbi:hypothetical protein J6590_034319 [Homalodisca vitripennis]|nr:hypothetical protein J6590_080028 [Homalodisca vitripennis]KAG8326780.1 hypothetical protein J6590_034319 [Homalodisca vitripennis]